MPRLAGRRSASNALNPWPGYVDALSTLLMVIIFVLLVFVLAQAFLSVSLSGRDRAVDSLNRRISELSETLSVERGHAGELQAAIAALERDLAAANAGRAGLARDLAAAREEQGRLATDRDALRTERDRLAARLADAELQARSALARNEQLQARIAEGAGRTDAIGQEVVAIAGQLAEARRSLTQTRAARDATQAELDRTTQADQATLAERTAEIAALTNQVRSLSALRDELEQQARQQAARLAAEAQGRQAATAQLDYARRALAEAAVARTALQAQRDQASVDAQAAEATHAVELAGLADQIRALVALRDQLEQQAREQAARLTASEEQRQAAAAQLADARRLGESELARAALLNQQLTDVRAQLRQVAAALDLAERTGREKDVRIAELGTRLNAALVTRVEELQRYRSEFFGRLRDVLQNRAGIQVVGDRFVFQSEVLFPVGSAELTPAGQEQIRKIAATLKEIMAEIPADLPWIMRVDGHADRQPVGAGAFVSNWELSAQRAINVVKLLIAEGVPATRLAATGFGEFQPLDGGETPASYARNRRIELRLTDR